MSKNLSSWINHLKVIASIRDKRKRNARLKAFADHMNLFDALKEVATNTINMNLPLNPNQKTKLRRYSKIIRELASKRKRSKLQKRKLIEQSGGFLPILIPLVASVIGEVIRNG